MSGTTSFRPATIPVLVCWLMAAASSVCLAQGNPPQNATGDKKACDFITKKEAQTILDTTVEAVGDGISECRFEDPQSPNSKLSLGVWYSASPDPNAFAETSRTRQCAAPVLAKGTEVLLKVSREKRPGMPDTLAFMALSVDSTTVDGKRTALTTSTVTKAVSVREPRSRGVTEIPPHTALVFFVQAESK